MAAATPWPHLPGSRGASSLIALKRAGLDPSEIGCVLLTHLHGDHFGGLPFLILDGQFSRRMRPLVIGGPAGVQDRVVAAMEVFFPGSSGVARRFAIEFVELRERVPSLVGPATVTPFVVEHASGAPAYALRVEYGAKVITYSGDTEWTESLVDAAQVELVVADEEEFLPIVGGTSSVQVDPEALGLRGPQGTPGAPGLVRAYGRIAASGTLDTSRANAGIVSARMSGAYYCVKFDPSINPAQAVPTLTLDGGTALTSMVAGANSTILYVLALGGGTGGTCNSDEVQIAVGGLTFSSGNLTATFVGPGSAFFVQVP